MSDPYLIPDAARYLATLLPQASPVMRRIEEEVAREGHPAVMPTTGALLRALVAASGGRRVLEVGTNLGYGVLWMAGGLAPRGQLDTIELDPELVRRARAHFAEAGLASQVNVHEGAALRVLPRLAAGAYDLVFLDCVKSEYPEYLDHARRLLRPGGILAADNVLWHGRMWDPRAKDEDSEGMRAFTAKLNGDASFVTSFVPLGDGLSVSVFRG